MAKFNARKFARRNSSVGSCAHKDKKIMADGSCFGCNFEKNMQTIGIEEGYACTGIDKRGNKQYKYVGNVAQS